ncbi:proton-coupled folate transporter-like [Aricia agestis]|uniref:proton-coupled folate transporter-like n=1 Tax=Aricia agestis TaxID=91739 RepID=UPI001C20AB87|nr:proton-coupled folate transporter-like [Aricia agestis]
MERLSKSREDIEQKVPLKHETNEEQKITALQRLKIIKNNVTIEPPVVLYFIASCITAAGMQNLNLEKACRTNLGFDDHVCTSLRLRQRANLTYEEDEVQKLVASVEAWRSAIYTAFPIILMAFLGAWSDKMGKRRICMLMPIGGELITCILNIVNTYFDGVNVEWTSLMGTFFLSITGAWCVMLMGSYSYISDITTIENRTSRLGALTLGLNITHPIGMGLSGIMLEYTGYYGVFGITGLVQLLNFLYIYYYTEDYVPCYKPETGTGGIGIWRHVTEFFDFNSLKDMVLILFKKGPNNQRMRVCMILSAVCFLYGPIWGDMSINYIMCRYRFNWDALKYSIYSSYSLTLHTFGTFLAIMLFTRRLKLDDSVLGIIAVISRIAGALAWALSRNEFEIYFAPIGEFFNGTMLLALRAISSKLVSSQELGKLYSLFGLSEISMMLIFVPIYARVYIATLHIFPGACYFFTVLFSIPALLIFVWFYVEYRRDLRNAAREECAIETDI